MTRSGRAQSPSAQSPAAESAGSGHGPQALPGLPPTFPAQHSQHNIPSTTAQAIPAPPPHCWGKVPEALAGYSRAGYTAEGGGFGVFGRKVLIWAAGAAAAGAEGWGERRMGDPGRSIIPGPRRGLQDQSPSLALKEGEKPKLSDTRRFSLCDSAAPALRPPPGPGTCSS